MTNSLKDTKLLEFVWLKSYVKQHFLVKTPINNCTPSNVTPHKKNSVKERTVINLLNDLKMALRILFNPVTVKRRIDAISE